MATSGNCAKCKKPNATSKCGACKMVYYCNVDCQRAHWKRHKKQCNKFHNETQTKIKTTPAGNHKEKQDTDISNTYVYKLVALGDTESGKSSIITRLVKGEFSEYYEATFGASCLTQMVYLRDSTVKFEIWDTSGRERLLSPLYYKSIAAAIVVYDITSSESFNRAKLLIDALDDESQVKMIALVGNKIDKEEEREVATADVKQYADDNSLYFIEISAKTNYNIDKLFYDIATRLPKVCYLYRNLYLINNNHNA